MSYEPENKLRSMKTNIKPRWSLNPKKWNHYMEDMFNDCFDIHTGISGMMDNIEFEEEIYSSGMDENIYTLFWSGGIDF